MDTVDISLLAFLGYHVLWSSIVCARMCTCVSSLKKNSGVWFSFFYIVAGRVRQKLACWLMDIVAALSVKIYRLVISVCNVICAIASTDTASLDRSCQSSGQPNYKYTCARHWQIKKAKLNKTKYYHHQDIHSRTFIHILKKYLNIYFKVFDYLN